MQTYPKNVYYTVSLVGDREIEASDMPKVAKALDRVIRKLLLTKKYVNFLVGRSGDFDFFAAAAVHRAREELNRYNYSLVLVLPYITNEYLYNRSMYESYYNEIMICKRSAVFNISDAYRIRSRGMIDCSDLVICCFQSKSGEANQTVKYAKKRKKKICSIRKQILI